MPNFVQAVMIMGVLRTQRGKFDDENLYIGLVQHMFSIMELRRRRCPRMPSVVTLIIEVPYSDEDHNQRPPIIERNGTERRTSNNVPA